MNHDYFYEIALRYARLGAGQSAPNPCVACVIVKNNQILAISRTAPYGRPHGEQIAIKSLSPQQLQGASAYITLEPCAHIGQTESCADLITQSKIKQVIYGQIDPDTRVSGKSLAKLQANGVETIAIQGDLAKQTQILNRGFVLNRLKNRPLIALKLATSADFKTHLQTGQTINITADIMRHYGRIMRNFYDAIMVGGQTIRADNPELTIRDGIHHLNRPRIILTAEPQTLVKSRIWQINHPQGLIILTKPHHQLPARDNTQIFSLDFDKQEANLSQALNILATKCGLTRILVESGGKLAKSLWQAGRVDEFLWFKSHEIIGDGGIQAFDADFFAKLNQYPILMARDFAEHGNFTHFQVN